jgi:hypothetical protein
MNEFDKLKALWQQGGKNAPDISDMMKVIKKNHRKMIIGHIALIIILALTFCVIAVIGLHYKFQYITTYVGIILCLLTIIYGITFHTRLFSVLNKKADLTSDYKSYLDQMIKYIHYESYIHTIGNKIYTILLTIALCLYMMEFAMRNLIFGIIIYTLTLAWIAFAYFFIGKRSQKKEKKKINDHIEHIKELITELEKE